MAEKSPPLDTYELFNVGNCYQEKHKDEKALQYYDAAIKANPDAYFVERHKGILLYNLGRYQEALDSLKKV